MPHPYSGPPAGPPPPPWATHRYPGALIAAAGCAVTVLAFLFLPYASFIVSMTAPQTIRFLVRSGDTGWQLVWLVPVLAALAGAVALTQRLGVGRRPAGRAAAFGLVQWLTGAVVLAYLANIAWLTAQGSDYGISVVDYLGAGFWLGLCGAVVGWVGARMESATLRRWSDEARRAGGWS